MNNPDAARGYNRREIRRKALFGFSGGGRPIRRVNVRADFIGILLRHLACRQHAGIDAEITCEGVSAQRRVTDPSLQVMPYGVMVFSRSNCLVFRYHPLKAPEVKPEMNSRCRTKKKASIGTAESNIKAKIWP